MDLDREAKVDFFVELTDNFLLLSGAADRPSAGVLGFVFVEPLGFTRLLGCGCCFALWESDGQVKCQYGEIYLLLLRWPLF